MKEESSSEDKLSTEEKTDPEPANLVNTTSSSPNLETETEEQNFSLLILAGLLLIIFFGLVFFSPSKNDTKITENTATSTPISTTTPKEKITYTENTQSNLTTRVEKYFAKARATKIFIEFLEDNKSGFDINQYDSCSTIRKDTYEYDHVFVYSYNQQDNFIDLSETLKDTLLDRFLKNDLENILEEERLTIEQIPLIFSTEDACTYINPLFDNFFDPNTQIVPTNDTTNTDETDDI